MEYINLEYEKQWKLKVKYVQGPLLLVEMELLRYKSIKEKVVVIPVQHFHLPELKLQLLPSHPL